MSHKLPRLATTQRVLAHSSSLKADNVCMSSKLSTQWYHIEDLQSTTLHIFSHKIGKYYRSGFSFWKSLLDINWVTSYLANVWANHWYEDHTSSAQHGVLLWSHHGSVVLCKPTNPDHPTLWLMNLFSSIFFSEILVSSKLLHTQPCLNIYLLHNRHLLK